MSIDSIGSIDANTSVVGVQQLYAVDPAERRLAARDDFDLNVLTAGDREFLSAVFGPQVVTTQDLTEIQARDEAQVQAIDDARALDQALDQAREQNRADEQLRAAQFINDLVNDRQNGQLPAGTEITASYVQARFDTYADLNGTVDNPLTEQNLIDARAYFNDRVQGAAIDLQA